MLLRVLPFFSILPFLSILSLLPAIHGTAILGCVELDSWTFNKTVRAFPYVVVKFDDGYPNGPKHKAYAQVAVDVGAKYDQLLFAEVRLKQYGDRKNEDLQKRFGLNVDMLPEVILFKDGKEAQRYGGDFNARDLMLYVQSKTGLYLSLPGCIEWLDQVAAEFISADPKRQFELIRTTQAKVDGMDMSEEEDKNAKRYLKIMKVLTSKGPSFIADENSRLNKLLKEKLSTENKQQIQQKLNILQSFAQSVGAATKDEL